MRKQLNQVKKVNGNVKKMLGDIANLVGNFRQLHEVSLRPEVAVDYRDLDYATKLEFVEGVEPPLEHVSQVQKRAAELIERLETKLGEALAGDDHLAGHALTEVKGKLREDEDLQTIVQQESEVKSTLLDLKDRRKRFADCNVQSTLRARSNVMTKVHAMFEQTQAKFLANKRNIEGLLSLDKTKPARRALL